MTVGKMLLPILQKLSLQAVERLSSEYGSNKSEKSNR
jgi:hypothetical protein